MTQKNSLYNNVSLNHIGGLYAKHFHGTKDVNTAFENMKKDRYTLWHNVAICVINVIKAMFIETESGKQVYYHCDIKPDNLMVCDGVVKLIDFSVERPFSCSISTRGYDIFQDDIPTHYKQRNNGYQYWRNRQVNQLTEETQRQIRQKDVAMSQELLRHNHFKIINELQSELQSVNFWIPIDPERNDLKEKRTKLEQELDIIRKHRSPDYGALAITLALIYPYDDNPYVLKFMNYLIDYKQTFAKDPIQQYDELFGIDAFTKNEKKFTTYCNQNDIESYSINGGGKLNSKQVYEIKAFLNKKTRAQLQMYLHSKNVQYKSNANKNQLVDVIVNNHRKHRITR